jgi:putative glutamine amidotransferase
MERRKPVIGITGAYVKHNEHMEGVYVHHDYHRTVAANGGIPIVLPYYTKELALETLSLCDGIIISGGEDVDPLAYNQDPHPKLGFTIPERDWVEFEIVRFAISHNIPLLAVCRGLQVLNVALGGTLIQDIPSQIKNTVQHSQVVNRSRDTHWINVVQDSQLYKIFGADRVRVNSLHHQAIDKVAEDLRVVALAEDGIVEAVEYIHPRSFILGVQWHPESMSSTNSQMNRLFEELITSCV